MLHHYHYHLRHHITLGQPNHDSDSDTHNNNKNNKIMPTDNSNNTKADKTTTSPPPAPCQKDECVGTLLVHQTDVQELSSVGSPKIVRRMTERVAKAIEHLPEQQIDPDDDILAWQCDI